MEMPPLPPHQFLCPISLDLMSDPVTLCTGITYDRLSIENWLFSGRKTCPVTNQVLVNKDLVPNVVLQRLIHGWCWRNKWLLNGSQVPTDSQVEPIWQLLQDIEDGSYPVLPLLRTVRTLALDNKLNREAVSSSRAMHVLCAALSRLRKDTTKWSSEDTGIYRETLGILCMLSLNNETKLALIHSAALPLAITFLDKADIQQTVNFVELLGILAREEHLRVELCSIQGFLGKLFDLLGQDANLVLLETTLVTLCELCVDNCFRLTALNLRTISKLTSLLRSREGRVCEKSVEFLQLLLSFPEDCRAAANEGAFILVPALTSAILEVSEAVTEHGVRVLYRLCIDKSCRREAVRAGAVAKALLLLQAHCTAATKRVAMKLLQLLSKDCNQVPYVYRQGRPGFPINRVEATA